MNLSPSATLTPKQAEIRSRESRILQLARPMVAENGLAGLSMEAIAKEMSYAKGTIYNHFACKEEILLALAIQANETRLELFKTATENQPHSRSKIGGIGVACEDFPPPLCGPVCHRRHGPTRDDLGKGVGSAPRNDGDVRTTVHGTGIASRPRGRSSRATWSCRPDKASKTSCSVCGRSPMAA